MPSYRQKKPFSAAKEELPFTAVTREALIHVAILTHEENAALKAEMACLKANMPRIQSKESSSVTLAAGFTGESVAVGTPMNAAANSFVPSAGGDESSVRNEFGGARELGGRGVKTSHRPTDLDFELV